jgi:BMFP domain-containing protein YqiC
MTDEATIQEIVEQIRKRADAPPETRVSFMDYDRDILLQAYDKLKEVSERVDTLFTAIQHGDKEHRKWLDQAIKDHFAGRPVERPCGMGTKEALEARIASLEAQLQAKERGGCPICKKEWGTGPHGPGICWVLGG